jgi:hypothetical protein
MRPFILLLLFYPNILAAQISVRNITQPDESSNKLYTCKDNILQLEPVSRNAVVTLEKRQIENPGTGIIKINATKLDTTRMDLSIFFGSERVYNKRFELIHCPNDGKSQAYPLDIQTHVDTCRTADYYFDGDGVKMIPGSQGKLALCLVPSDPAYRITSFTVSYLPCKGEYQGPFTCFSDHLPAVIARMAGYCLEKYPQTART